MPAQRSHTTRKPSPAVDFLVIGSGVAGLRAAIGLSRAGRVMILTKGTTAEGSSIYAQGGVAVAPEEEDIALHHTSRFLRAYGGRLRPAAPLANRRNEPAGQAEQHEQNERER